MRCLFVTGTDTGAGKTLVTAALAIALRRAGHAVRALKPVATGGVPAEDTRVLALATETSAESVTGWSFREPAAPPVAARAEGRTLDLADILAWIRDHQQREPESNFLVEGVGGLLCPLTNTATIADLAVALGHPVLIVARRGLGTLNHTLLTVEAARGRGLSVAGVLLTETVAPTTLAEATAPEELRRRLPVPILGVLAHRHPADPARLADDLTDLAGRFDARANF